MWYGRSSCNKFSIGIELDNTGFEEFAEPLMLSLLAIMKELNNTYHFKQHNIAGHCEVAPNRKDDPVYTF